MKKSLSLLLAISVIASLLLSACVATPAAQAPAAADAPAAAAAPSEASLSVGYAVPDASNPFLSNLTKSVAEYFAPDGVEVIVADAQGDATKQVNQIENFTTMGVDAIIVMAIDPKGVTSVIENAQKAGVKVMVAGGDTGVYDAIMHTDQHAMGAMIAQMACDFIAANYAGAADGSVEVGIIENRDTPEANQRADGMATVTELCPAAAVAGVVGGAADDHLWRHRRRELAHRTPEHQGHPGLQRRAGPGRDADRGGDVHHRPGHLRHLRRRQHAGCAGRDQSGRQRLSRHRALWQ
jgi:ribose transport system substrate-binding protein